MKRIGVALLTATTFWGCGTGAGGLSTIGDPGTTVTADGTAPGDAARQDAPAASPRCGDGRCEAAAGETCTSCPADCGCAPGLECSGGICGGGDCGAAACSPLWSAQCSGDGGLRICGIDPESGCPAEGPFVACAEGNSCGASACSGSCLEPELMLLVDRSSSMEGARWDFVRGAVAGFARGHEARARLGVRVFPGEEGCLPGESLSMATDQAEAIEGLLTPPSSAGSTPITAALEGLDALFGDPNQGQAVVVITDGSETCATTTDTLTSVAALRTRGVRVYAIAVGTSFDQVFLDELAALGGSGALREAADGAALRAALDAIATELGVCPAGGAGGCGDGARSGDESDVDCGGSCTPCTVGKACLVGADCASGACDDGTCGASPGCLDGVRNGPETDVDCGGPLCPGCEEGEGCAVATDCAAGACLAGSCRVPTCSDGQRNQGEAGPDCAGPCPALCGLGVSCAEGAECQSGFCDGAACAEPPAACGNGSKDGRETDVDCGGADCPACPSFKNCQDHTDCLSRTCLHGVCRDPTCADGVQNQDETGVDCGGACAAQNRVCEDGGACTVSADCRSQRCTQGVCTSCQDGLRNGGETGVDCGGGCATNNGKRCGAGEGCAVATDCMSEQCTGGRCSHCGDGQRNGDESDVDCGGSCPECALGKTCGRAGDCASGYCFQWPGEAAKCTDRWVRPSPADGTQVDAATGKSWIPRIASGYVFSWEDAQQRCRDATHGGRTDWRTPTIDELRALIEGCPATVTGGSCPVRSGGCLAADCRMNCSCAYLDGPGEHGCYLAPSHGLSRNNCRTDFWSTTRTNEGFSAWVVEFSNAQITWESFQNSAAITCVAP